jgi:hypothetical protein
LLELPNQSRIFLIIKLRKLSVLAPANHVRGIVIVVLVTVIHQELVMLVVEAVCAQEVHVTGIVNAVLDTVIRLGLVMLEAEVVFVAVILVTGILSVVQTLVVSRELVINKQFGEQENLLLTKIDSLLSFD